PVTCPAPSRAGHDAPLGAPRGRRPAPARLGPPPLSVPHVALPLGFERDIPSVRRDRRLAGLARELPTVGTDADALSPVRHPVTDKDVRDVVRVTGDEVRGVGPHHDVAAARADRRQAGARVPLNAVRTDVDAL